MNCWATVAAHEADPCIVLGCSLAYGHEGAHDQELCPGCGSEPPCGCIEADCPACLRPDSKCSCSSDPSEAWKGSER